MIYCNAFFCAQRKKQIYWLFIEVTRISLDNSLLTEMQRLSLNYIYCNKDLAIVIGAISAMGTLGIESLQAF